MSATVRPTFTARGSFFSTLRSRVDDYFKSNQIAPRDHWRWYLKGAIIVLAFVFCYVQLVFFTNNLAMAILWAFGCGHGIALIGFNVMHDAAHGAASKRNWVNRLYARTLDFIGASVFLWRFKHNVLHHTYPNVESWDEDLDSGGLLRFSPHSPRKPWHRFQHFYALILYGVLSAYWVISDFFELIKGEVGGHKIPNITAKEVALFLLGKFTFIGYAIVLPLFFHPWWLVVLGFLFVEMVAGIIMSLVFQLAHVIQENEFLELPPNGKIDDEWAIHQLKTTANFAPDNPIINWYTGGLNHQVEHHLFPRISHVHYPAICKIVKATCDEFDVEYREHKSFTSALMSHMRMLYKLGRPVAA